MTLPIGRFVHRPVSPSRGTQLVLGRFVSATFKVRYVRTPAGAKRYGVPIGSPIPVGRRVKPGTVGRGRGGSSGRSGPSRVPVAPAQRPAARRNFWGPDAEDRGARWDDDANELEVHDPQRARASLDEALQDPSLDADQRRRTRQLRDSIADDVPDADPEAAPEAPADVDAEPTAPGVDATYRPASRVSPADWADEDVEAVRAAQQNEWGEDDYGDQSNQDPKLAKVWELQGFDGHPQRLSPEEFDALGDDHVRMFRGIHGEQAQQWADEFREGPSFAGLGVYGNGTYATIERSTAQEYADQDGGPGEVLEMALPPNARVVDHEKVWDEWFEKMEAAGLPREFGWAFGGDTGTIASALGYDAIRVVKPELGSEHYYVVLNRTAVVVKDPAVSGPGGTVSANDV